MEWHPDDLATGLHAGGDHYVVVPVYLLDHEWDECRIVRVIRIHCDNDIRRPRAFHQGGLESRPVAAVGTMLHDSDRHSFRTALHDIDRVVVMDSGDGGGVSNAVNQRVQGAYGTLEGLASTLGIDIQEVLQGRLGSGKSAADGD